MKLSLFKRRSFLGGLFGSLAAGLTSGSRTAGHGSPASPPLADPLDVPESSLRIMLGPVMPGWERVSYTMSFGSVEAARVGDTSTKILPCVDIVQRCVRVTEPPANPEDKLAVCIEEPGVTDRENWDDGKVASVPEQDWGKPAQMTIEEFANLPYKSNWNPT